MPQCRIIRIACALLLAGTLAQAASVVSNAQYKPRLEGTSWSDFYYDLADASGPVMVSVVLSNDNGKTWNILPDPRALRGDVGTSVTNGTGKHIMWNRSADRFPAPLGAQGVQVRIIASEIGHTKTITLPGGVPLELVRIPAGTFPMGSTQSGNKDELPLHMVWIKKDFYLGRTEVSQRQWMAVMQPNPSGVQGNPDLPVEGASWNLCAKFVDKLNTLGQGTFRMPSEAEWEYACRAGTTTRWFCGDDPKGLLPYAWTGANSKGTTHAVGGKRPNPFGLCDTLGGVFEWVADWYHPNYKGAPADGSAWDAKDPENPWRVCRGGAFHMGETISTPAYRTVQYPDEEQSWYGLRLALDAE